MNNRGVVNIPDTKRLTALEESLTKQLEQSGLSPVPLWVNCFLGEVLLILVEFPDNYYLNLEKIQAFLYKRLKKEHLSQDYFVEIYYFVDGKYCSLELDKKATSLITLSSEIFNQCKNLVLKLQQKPTNSSTKKNQANQLSWLVMGWSLATITTISLVYGLTRPCVFDKCSDINQAEKLFSKSEILLQNSLNDAELNLVKTNLESAINLLSKIPFWSDYYQESSQLKNQYQQQLDDILLLESAKNQQEKAILSSRASPLSIQQLEAVKQELKTAIAKIELINDNDILEEVKNKEYKEYSKNVQLIDQKIVREKQASKSLKQAKLAASLAKRKENTADNVNSLQLVYNSWKTAIKRLQEIPAETTAYQESRLLLKTYISNKNRIEKRKEQESIAVKMYEKANNYAKLAEKSEQNNQWLQAVNYWSMATVHINKVPNNTFKWKEVQPLILTYNLSFAKARNKSNEIRELKKISSELDAICNTEEPICKYEITEKIIKIKLKSNYLEQLWMIALQAKAKGNLQIQVELLKHLSTFENRLQTMSNQTGKYIEVYNPQGKLMTAFSRSQ
ncbi:MAG: hypothetical protein AB4057_08935 [Crocosphaera sp.]